MSSFTEFSGELHTVKAPEASKILGGDYRHIDPGFEFYLSPDNPEEKVIIERGYLSDGASIPFPIRWFLRPWGTYGQCAVVHDKLCETWATNLRQLESREELDKIFFTSMEVAGIEKPLRKVIEAGINFYRWWADPQKPTTDLYKKGFEDAYLEPVAVVIAPVLTPTIEGEEKIQPVVQPVEVTTLPVDPIPTPVVVDDIQK